MVRGRRAALTPATPSTTGKPHPGASWLMAAASASGIQWPCPSCLSPPLGSSSMLRTHIWGTMGSGQVGTYLGRPQLSHLAGPGHSKGALSSTGLPGR